MKPGLKRGLLIGGGVILVGAIVIANVAKGQGGRQGVQVDDVTLGDISATVRAPAKIQPETLVKLSANVPGEVVRLSVKEGDQVRKGQFLLQLDPARRGPSSTRARRPCMAPSPA
jgi:multidrug efflux pump subunit AcrA (membrane-fusion protein)